jgi:RNase P subunit RPR2
VNGALRSRIDLPKTRAYSEKAPLSYEDKSHPIPEVNLRPTSRPRACPYCANPILHRHGVVQKRIKDHKIHTEVEAHRYKCLSCGGTFRHYPTGVTRKDRSKRAVVLAALMYGLGLS